MQNLRIGIKAPAYTFTRLLCKFLQTKSATRSWSAPLLETLTLQINLGNETTQIKFHDVLSKIRSPSLRSLDVYELGFTTTFSRDHISCKALTSLILRGCAVCCSLSRFIALLGWFPLLERLAIQDLDWSLCTSYSTPQHIISPPCLKTMEIICEPNDLLFLSKVLRHITIPPSAAVLISIEYRFLRAHSLATLEEIANHIGVPFDKVPTRETSTSRTYIMSADPTLNKRMAGSMLALPNGLLLHRL